MPAHRLHAHRKTRISRHAAAVAAGDDKAAALVERLCRVICFQQFQRQAVRTILLDRCNQRGANAAPLRVRRHVQSGERLRIVGHDSHHASIELGHAQRVVEQ